MKNFYKILYGIFTLLLIVVAALFFSPLVPMQQHVDVKIVKSGSMEPKIKTGGIVVIRPADTYRVGDVITFDGRSSDIPTTHRIVDERIIDGQTMFTTKGDANEDPDTESTSLSAVRGKVLFTIPYAGFVLDFARQPRGFMLLVALPALLIVIDEIGKIWTEVRRIRRPVATRKDIAPLVVAPYVPSRVRVRMIDINKPILVHEEILERQRQNFSSMRRDMPSSRSAGFVMAGCVVLAITTLTFGLSNVGATISYVNDSETAIGNILGAHALDFTAIPDKNVFLLPDNAGGISNDSLITLVAPEAESVPLRYTLTTEFVSGNKALCDGIMVDTDSPFVYHNSLTALTAQNVLFSDSWTLHIALNGGTFSPEDTCVVDLVYTGWDASLAEGSGGYGDEERVQLTFTIPTPAPAILQPLSTFSGVIEGLAEEDDSQDIISDTPKGDVAEGEGTPTDKDAEEENKPGDSIEDTPAETQETTKVEQTNQTQPIEDVTETA